MNAKNDRVNPAAASNKVPKPEVEIIVDGNSVFKPGMKTFFVESTTDGAQPETSSIFGSENVIVGGTVCTCNSVCTCNTVCTCESVCSCESYVACSCQGYQVCTCDAVCTCQSYTVCTCESQGYTYCSCDQVCTCHPVH